LTKLPPERSTSAKIGKIGDSLSVLTSIGDRTSAEGIARQCKATESARIYRLSQIPIPTVRQFDNIFPNAAEPDLRRMLRDFAVDTNAELDAFPTRLSAQRPYFGIVFPYQNDLDFWQFFSVDRWKQPQAMPLYTACTGDASGRLRNALDLAALSSKQAIVIGCGAIGSTVALELAAAGLGKLALFDFDRLTIGNVRRHECSFAEIGKLKTVATAEKIAVKNPDTQVTLGGDIYSDPRFEEAVKAADIVFVTVGNENLERFVNGICLTTNTTCVHCYVGLHARVGHVVRTVPFETGCFDCLLTHYYDGKLPQLPPVDDPNSVVVELGCNNPALPGAGFDLRTVALAAVRRGIQTLIPDSYRDDFSDITVLNLRKVSDIDPYSLKIERLELPRLDDCPSCGEGRNQTST
jgi:hypothetical protein